MEIADDIRAVPVTTIVKKKKRSHLEYTYGGQVTTELLPFKGVMAYQLSKRGFNTRNLSFRELVPLYYNEFVSNKGNPFSSYQPINCYDFRNNISFKVRPSDNFNGDINSFRVKHHFSEVNNVVDGIVNHFKIAQLKKRYAFAQGQNPYHTMTDEELVQARATDRITSHLENQILFDRPIKQGSLLNMLFWGFMLLALYYILE